MAQRFRTLAANACVAFFFCDDDPLSAGFDVRKFEFFAQNLGELFEGDFHFEQMLAGRIAGMPVAVLRITGSERGSDVTVSLAHTPTLMWIKTKSRQINSRDRD